ncbi:MAG: hypothetical protein N2689_11020 [Verrucomicrobiae bacterium]|nr:hypothetical protein [Verrucomicrobiae bacterium]
MKRSFFWNALLTFVFCSGDAFAWGGEHERITQAAIETLPQSDRDCIGPEQAALAGLYCTFPDKNWPCYGEWGGGVGDPRLPRFPDTRREWDISFYCGWDPVLRQGKPYPHAPPHSCDAAAALVQKTVESLREGRHEDGIRFLGAALHYVQDSGSFPHVQPVHRVFHVTDLKMIRADYLTPRFLGRNSNAVANRVRDLVRWTEERAAMLWQGTGITFEEARQLAAKNTMPGRVVEAVKKIRAEKAAEFDAVALDCANECLRACADVMHTALTLGRERKPPAPVAPNGRNAAFNPSFEGDDGDGVPDGWHVGWLDLNDRAGRAEWYRVGTHFEKHVRTGRYSVLIFCAPTKGLEWRPTWRRAIRISEGGRCRVSVWAKTRAAAGTTCLALEFYNAAYQPISRVCSESLSGDQEWRLLCVEAAAPKNARWLRPILRAEANSGAAWFDDVEVSLRN